MPNRWPALPRLFLVASLGCGVAGAAEVRLLERPLDPHGSPRPARGSDHNPLRTSLYVEIAVHPPGAGDAVDPDTVTVRIGPEGRPARPLVDPGGRFVGGATGWLRPTSNLQGEAALAVYVETGTMLEPATTYAVAVAAKSRRGLALDGAKGTWTFRTEGADAVHPVALPLDLDRPPVRWHGGFFRGFGNVSFCTRAETFGPTYDLMAEARKRHPRAWSLQRDFWMTGTDFLPPGLLPFELPNVVHERETRRITDITPDPDGRSARLTVADVFGSEQHGVEPNRPLGGDYHAGDEVLVADGVRDASARVVAVDDGARTVRISPAPAGEWKIADERPLPDRDDPDVPGRFATGGCYLRKLRPHGTAAFFWGRLDKEWDLAHRRYGRRLLVNFADAAGDLSRDGRSWTTAKDLVQWHDVARDWAGHVIDRYGDAALTFPWSVFNEPDLGPLFWRADWAELQRFYDYTVDGVLRAFEDRGYDSDRVFIGGLELGGIFGTNLKLNEFLAHCSPRAGAKAEGALPLNAAVADRRLDGRRSRRVEALCRASGGKGSPCDFVSIHAYNRSAGMAAKLVRAKEMALAVDPEYYADLWVNSHENCPDWMPPPDEAAADSYLGNGYFPAWAVDVARRLLARAAEDPRYGFGESILTVWPPNQNLAGLNAVTRVLHADDDGDGRADRKVTVPMPIFHVFNLLSDLDGSFWVLPERTVGGHVVGGFAARDGATTRVALVAHAAHDTQSRSGHEFAATVEVAGLPADANFAVRSFRFDRADNTSFEPARALRAQLEPPPAPAATLDRLVGQLRQDDRPDDRRAALRDLAALGRAARPALGDILGAIGVIRDPALRAEARAVVERTFAVPALPGPAVERLRSLGELQVTDESRRRTDAAGRLSVPARLRGNGVVFLELAPVP